MRKAIAVLAAVYLLCLAGCSGQENIDTMNLQLVSGLVSEKGYDGDNFLEKLAGQSREDMISLWGEPDGQLSGFWGDIWNLEDNNSHYIVLYYNSEGYVEDVVVGTNAHYHIENIVDRTKTEGLPYDTAEEKFFEDSDNEYYFSGIYSHYVIVHYEDGSQEDIVTALNAGRATIADLDKFEIEYIVKTLGDGDNAAAFVSNDEVTPEFFTMDELVDVEAVEAAGGEIISSTYTTYNQFLSNLSMSSGKRSQIPDDRIVLAVEIYYPNGFDHVKVGFIQNCVAISLFDAETGDFLGAEYNSVDGDYEQQTTPNLGPAEQSYSVGEPRCEDEDSAVEGCYDDPNNPLAEQTYRVGEPRYE